MTPGRAISSRIPSVSSLRSGRDWAAWLRQACPVPSPGSALHRSQGSAESWNALVHLARRQGFAVNCDSRAAGEGITTWPDRQIRVPSSTAPGQAVTALAHQIGHVLLHGEIARLDPGGTAPCQGTRKVEADSVAYLVSVYLGIDPPAITFPHISSWAGTDPRAHPLATIQAVSDRVLAAATRITTHLSAQLAADAEATSPALTPGAAVSQPAISPLVPRDELIHAHEAAARFFRGQLRDSWVPGYLAGRGFGPAVQQQIGRASCRERV